MATIPTPPSYNQVIGDMIDAFLSRLGIPSLPDGDPILSILEAAAQSDVRTSSHIFQLLASVSLNRASGQALQNLGADEGLTLRGEFPASGFVTISDTSFTKIQSTIYQGRPAPIVGSASIDVVSAVGWPSTGSVYIARGTNQFEGPLVYTSLTDNTTYWTINLNVGSYLQKAHNLGEAVVLAQGGERTVSPGQTVQTSQGGSNQAIQFSVSFPATIPDGETEIQNVSVVAVRPGVSGNVPSGAINSFSSNPFVGATVTNPTSFTSGQAVEDEESFKERIRLARQSRSRGTATSIQNAVVGITDATENKRVLSAKLLTRQNEVATLYIDDGTGYEEKTAPIATETIVESALGGEKYFSVTKRPVAKAFAVSAQAPFNLSSGAQLAVLVGGQLNTHTFSVDDFKAINNASAYEVVASINANPNLAFNARTSGSGTRVSIFADAETNEDIEVVSAPNDANSALGFAVGRDDTLKLYKNDRLLTKDGTIATLQTKAQSQWSAMASGETLQIKVDNTQNVSTVTFNDSDFVDTNTRFSTLSQSNSLESWAKVLEYKIPGLTATPGVGTITITSNLGRDSRAAIEIVGGTLVSNNMFNLESSFGSDSDYSFNRSLGQLRLGTALSEFDRLTIGTASTRAFVESDVLGVVTLASDAKTWWCVDGNASVVLTGVGVGTTVSPAVASVYTWGKRMRFTVASAPFGNVKTGDWLIAYDPAMATDDQGTFRIVAATSSYLEVEQSPSYISAGPVVLTEGGFVVVRSTTAPQPSVVPAAPNYTALTIAAAIALNGATAQPYKTTKVRVRTNSFDLNGSISLVAQNAAAVVFGFELTTAPTQNLTSHLASVVSKPQGTTPIFSNLIGVAGTAGPTSISAVGSSAEFDSGKLLAATKSYPDSGVIRFSNDGYLSAITEITGAGPVYGLTLREPVLKQWFAEDFVYQAQPYALTSQDKLLAVVDDDSLTRRYSINMFRRVRPGSSTYGLTNDFSDSDNSNLSLAVGFGTAFKWTDFAVWMKARTKTHLSGGLNTTQTILWRYFRFGPDGNQARLQYRYPKAASQTTAIEIDQLLSARTNLKVILPSGAARTGNTIRATTKIGCASTSVSGDLHTHWYVAALSIASATRTFGTTVTLTLTLPGPITDHGLQIGNQITVNSSSGSFGSGLFTIIARSATTIAYTEAGANVTVASIGSLSHDNVGIAGLGGSVLVGDVFGVQTGTGLVAPFSNNATRIFTVDVGGKNWQTTTDVAPVTTTTVLSWYQVNDPTKISFYPINSGTNTATLIASTVGSLANTPVQGVAVGGGSGQIEYATYEAAPNGEGATNPWYALTDGVNYVKSHNTPATTSQQFSFTFKQPITASLSINSDWANEEVRVIPTTVRNVVDYLNSTATSPLSSVADIAVSENSRSVQISSKTPGSAGSVQIQGGTANSVAATAQTSTVYIQLDRSEVASVGFLTTDLDGVSSGMTVVLENPAPTSKPTRFTSTTTLVSRDSAGNYTVGVNPAWEYSTTAPGFVGGASGVSWQFVKQGNFVQARCLGATFAGVREGDVVVLKNLNSTTSANDGFFRVIENIADNVVFLENTNAVEDIGTYAAVFLKYNSVLPADTLALNTVLWGDTGNYSVESIDLPSTTVPVVPFNGTGSTFKFKVAGSTTSFTGPVALGTQSSLVQLTEGSATRLIKRISSISPSTATLSDVNFSSTLGMDLVGAGTIMRPLDKLDFSTALAAGFDGYTYNTGLLAKANDVVFGVESDPSTYPGFAAAGSNLVVSGPLVKRLYLTLAVRLQTGIDATDVFNQIKGQCAGVVNEAKIGTPIAISEIVRACQNVNGVLAVSVVSPEYNSANDLIAVQPYEKPLILNADTDISITLVGE